MPETITGFIEVLVAPCSSAVSTTAITRTPARGMSTLLGTIPVMLLGTILENNSETGTLKE